MKKDLNWVDLGCKIEKSNAKRAALIFPFVGHYIVFWDALAQGAKGSGAIYFLFDHQIYLLYFSAFILSSVVYLYEMLCPDAFKGIGSKAAFDALQENGEIKQIVEAVMSPSEIDSFSWVQKKEAYWSRSKMSGAVGRYVEFSIKISIALGGIYVAVGVLKVFHAMATGV